MINRWFICFVLLMVSLQASVKVYAPATFIKNEALVFELEAKGEHIEFPSIDTIDGFPVQKAGTSNQITIINGKKSKTVNKKYRLYPTSNIVIPSFSVLIDSKTFTTTPKTITIQEAKKTQHHNFEFKVIANKKKVYVGEPIVVDYIFKYKKDDKILELGLSNLIFEHFWFKKLEDATTKEEGDYIVQELKYLLFPQKSGPLHLSAAKVVATMMDVSSQYSFFQRPTKQIDIYSNALDFEVSALPKGVQLVGDFTINEKLNKEHLQSGEALSYTITIKGHGNLEDMPNIELDIPNATIYANEPQTSFSFEKGEYQSTYSKTFSIVANDSFVIPSVNIPYFLVNKKRVEYLKTKEYTIDVASKKKPSAPILQKAPSFETKEKRVDNVQKEKPWLYFIYGILTALLLVIFAFYIRKVKGSKKVETSLEKKVKSAKTAKELIQILLPYLSKNKELDALIFELEKRDDLDIKIKKKEIIKILKLSF